MSSEQPKSKLVLATENGSDQILEIDAALTIGRSPSNQLMLEDQKVSRRHAEIRMIAPGRYRLTDLGSANGTWLNRRRLIVPSDLQNGDVIQIGAATLRFESAPVPAQDLSCVEGTATHMLNQYVVVLVTDIRNYTTMSESLPRDEFSRFVKDWFKECGRVIELHGGMIDKFIGDAVMCYWLVPDCENPGAVAGSALAAARTLIDSAKTFSTKLAAIFPGQAFNVGVGLSMGNALLGNVGTAMNQSITLVGDSVNIAFRLEALTKEKQQAILVTSNIAGCAPANCLFVDLGQAEVKGRKKPVDVSALVLEDRADAT